MVEDGFDPARVRHFETLLTLCNGYAGLRGSPEMTPLLGEPGTYIAGVYEPTGEHAHEIVNLPLWLGVAANMDGFDFDLRSGQVLEYRRTLDMKQGLLLTRIVWRDGAKRTTRWQSTRLLHARHKHLGLIWGTVTALDYSGTLRLGGTLDAWATRHGSESGRSHFGAVSVGRLAGGGIALDVTLRETRVRVAEASRLVAPARAKRSVQLDDDRACESVTVPMAKGRPVAFEKRAVFYTSRDVADAPAAAEAELTRLSKQSVRALVRSHTAAWANTWEAADVRIEGDPRAQRALRFSIFHLASLANPDDDRVSIGAKGLHGNGYRGMVFWDTELYMLPFFVHTRPAAAKALLAYRHHLLPDARVNAAKLGFAGARPPWTSSRTARENAWLGWQEHLGADIAYAVDQYVRATGDRDFYLRQGAELIIDTAAYWHSRVEFDEARGRYVLRDLAGPDEIHTHIDNNAFTNYLVRWHLRRAVAAVVDLDKAGLWDAMRRRLGLSAADVAEWGEISDRMFENFDARRGFHQQFDGYFRLPERKIDRAMTKMQYTGPVQASFRPTRVAQQADTVMLYYLFVDAFPAAVRRAGFRYYEPRCSHTSTLSRCIYAAVAARAGLTQEAYRLFLESLETDIGPTAECDSGIHAACLGGNWQAAVMGFGGFTVRNGRPAFEPRLPGRWKKLAFSLRWRGKSLSVEISRRAIRLRTRAGTLAVEAGGHVHRIGPRSKTIAI